MDQNLTLIIRAGVPTLAVIVMSIRRELIMARVMPPVPAADTSLARIASLENRLDAHLRDWAKITMQHNSDIARLKEKVGLTD